MTAVTKANGVSNEWAMIPQGLDSGDANNDGGMGELVDVRWGAMPPALPSGRVTKAQVSPTMLAGRWVKMGGFWLPGVPSKEFETS